jgi:lipoteichoic acid synthase
LGKNVLDGREHRTLADREVAFVLLNTPYTISYEETAGQIDVYPTLLDVMGCNEYGWKGLGYSLFRTPVESAVYWDGSSLGNRRSPLYSRQTQAWDISRLMITGDFFSGKSFGYDEE